MAKIAEEAKDLSRPLAEATRGTRSPGEDAPEGRAFNPALVFDAEARLIHVSAAFAELVGLAAGSLIGTEHPFPWCHSGFQRCRDRIQLLAGRQARELGIEAVSWSLSRQCGECVAAYVGPEMAQRAFENELRGAMCFAVCDAETTGRIGAMLSPEAATPRRELEAALRRIALEVQRLGLSVVLPVRPEKNVHEDLRALSPREWEVLHPFMEGRRVSSIARMLSISPHTVRNHLKSIYGKLGVNSQAELIEKLREDLSGPQLPDMPQ